MSTTPLPRKPTGKLAFAYKTIAALEQARPDFNDEWTGYLKDGETPFERFLRERKDLNALTKLYQRALEENERLKAQQPQAEALSDDLRDRLVAIGQAIADQDDRAAQAMIREILAAPRQAEAVPPGFVLVPVEPTEAVLRALIDCQDADPEDGPMGEADALYRAMLAAAQGEKP